MAVPPDVQPLPPLPHKPPSRLLHILNSSITLTLPTINSTIYSTVTQNYIDSFIQSKSSKCPIESSKNCKINKNDLCLINLNSPCKVDSMDDSHLWSYNKEEQSVVQPLLLTKWMDLIHEIIDLYNH